MDHAGARRQRDTLWHDDLLSRPVAVTGVCPAARSEKAKSCSGSQVLLECSLAISHPSLLQSSLDSPRDTLPSLVAPGLPSGSRITSQDIHDWSAVPFLYAPPPSRSPAYLTPASHSSLTLARRWEASRRNI